MYDFIPIDIVQVTKYIAMYAQNLRSFFRKITKFTCHLEPAKVEFQVGESLVSKQQLVPDHKPSILSSRVGKPNMTIKDIA